MRIGIQTLIWTVNADTHHSIADNLPSGIPGNVTVRLKSLDHLGTNPLNWIEAGGWILKDHGNPVATNISPSRLWIVCNVLTVKQHLPGRNSAGPVNQTHRGKPQNSLSRSGFPYDTQHLTSGDIQVYIVDRNQGPILRWKFDPQSFD